MSQHGSRLVWVLDYAAMGRPSVRPTRLHRTDCWHPSVHSKWRKATAEELRLLPECQDCQHRDADGV
jgi:hypothetical protein